MIKQQQNLAMNIGDMTILFVSSWSIIYLNLEDRKNEAYKVGLLSKIVRQHQLSSNLRLTEQRDDYILTVCWIKI